MLAPRQNKPSLFNLVWIAHPKACMLAIMYLAQLFIPLELFYLHRVVPLFCSTLYSVVCFARVKCSLMILRSLSRCPQCSPQDTSDVTWGGLHVDALLLWFKGDYIFSISPPFSLYEYCISATHTLSGSIYP